MSAASSSAEPTRNSRAELEHPLGHARRLELVGEHRRDGHRQVAGDGEHRQVGAQRRVEQPLLPERVGPEALDVGHVAVQDEGDVAHVIRPPPAPPEGSPAADGDEVQGLVEVARLELEVARR